MSQQFPAPRLVPPAPAPASPTPSAPSPTQPGSPQPFLPSPGESAILWLAIGIATLFAGYLIVDGLIHYARRRRSERRWKERARLSALQAAAETPTRAHQAGRPISELPANPPPPRG